MQCEPGTKGEQISGWLKLQAKITTLDIFKTL